jgi:hypothetical protein
MSYVENIRHKTVTYTADEIAAMVVKFRQHEVKHFKAGELNVPYRPGIGPEIDETQSKASEA